MRFPGWSGRRVALHLAAWVIGLSALRLGVAPPEVCPEVELHDVDTAIERAAAWAIDNLDDDGRFLYRYRRTDGVRWLSYNLPRHAGMSLALYQAAGAGFVSIVPGADRSLAFMLDNLVEHDDWVAFATPDRAVKAGATGLMVAALVYRRRATGEPVYDDLIRAGARFLLQQQEVNGAVAAFWSREREEPEWGTYGAFATGEAMWALALAGEIFPEDGFTEAARRTGRYIATERRRQEGYVLRLPDHWASYAFDALNGGFRPQEVTYLERLAGDFAAMTRLESSRTGQGVQRYLRFGQGLPAGVGALGEGVAGLYRLSERKVALSELRHELRAHLLCIGAMLVERQTTPLQSRTFAEPARVAGAWFRADVTQVDDQQHTLSTLVAVRDALGGSAPSQPSEGSIDVGSDLFPGGSHE